MKSYQCTVAVQGVHLQVEYAYQPHEPMTLTYPGCEQSVEIEIIYLEPGVELPDIFCTEELYEILETAALKHHQSTYSNSRRVMHG
jgi:hypothetical protein